jgi:hypothetical protein
MKKLLFLLLFLPAMAFSQDYRTQYVRQDTAVILNRAYASGTVDTCQVLSAEKFKEAWLTVQVTDTASIHFKVMQSVDGSTWTPVSAAFDSVSVAAATGGIRTLNIKSTVGNAKFKLVFNQTAFRVPVAGTHLYSAIITFLQ